MALLEAVKGFSFFLVWGGGGFGDLESNHTVGGPVLATPKLFWTSKLKGTLVSKKKRAGLAKQDRQPQRLPLSQNNVRFKVQPFRRESLAFVCFTSSFKGDPKFKLDCPMSRNMQDSR